jgi:hypothetical protein
MSFMMRPRDSFTLAFTKLRVRRIRLGITLIVMSLLFAALVFLSLITAGAVTSFHAFGKEGLGGRYIVSGYPIGQQPYDNQDLVNILQDTNKDLSAKKTALAKKYDIPYEAKTDPALPLAEQQVSPDPNDRQLMANVSSPLTITALSQLNAKLPISYNDFSTLAKQNNAAHIYQSTASSFGSAGTDGAIKVLKDGKEDYDKKQPNMSSQPTGLDSITSLGWNQMSDDLLRPFLLPGQTTTIGADGSIPTVAPYSAAEQLMGLSKLPATATSQQKLERLQAVRAVAGKTAPICYRNQASQDLLQKAISQIADINANKNKSGYTMPSLQYSLPTEPCGATTIKKDTRTTEEKEADNHQDELNAITSGDTSPVQGVFPIRIVGITNDISGVGTSMEAGGLVSSIVSSSLGQGWLSPASAFQPDSLPTKAQGGLLKDKPVAQQQYYAEFNTLADAKAFIEKNNCSPPQDQMTGPNSALDACNKLNKHFYLSPYGNNAGAIEDFQHSVWKVARFVLLGVVVIATVVLMGTLGKIIADSRRETAVFRSLGARRLHVSQIYIIYTLLVSVMIIVLSFVLGSAGALFVSHHFEPSLSVAAVLAYNARDVHQHFSLFAINTLYLAIIAAIVVATALLAAAIPLLTNMRRNPIRDMRDEG